MGIPTKMMATDQSQDGCEWSMAEHRRAVDEESSSSPWPAILAEYGSLEAWFAACRERRNADTDRPLARVIRTLTTDAPGRPRGTLRPPERSKLLGDRPLAAFWISVVSAGDEGFAEERKRIGQGDISGIKKLLPLWRSWGQVLLDAGAVTIDETTFKAPQ